MPSHGWIFPRFCYLNFMKFIFLGFRGVCSTREDLSIDASITNVGLILTKLRWFQLFVTSQISNLKKKKNQFFGFPWCSTRKVLSTDVSITNVGLILISFFGIRTDRQGFGILIWKHVDTQKISTQSSKLVVSSQSLYASRRSGMHIEQEKICSSNLIALPH